MWRPSRWEETAISGIYHQGRLVKIIKIKDIENEERNIFEAGADAILKALREMGQHYDVGSSDEIWWLKAKEGFTLVFIPDEDNKKEEVKDNG